MRIRYKSVCPNARGFVVGSMSLLCNPVYVTVLIELLCLNGVAVNDRF